VEAVVIVMSNRVVLMRMTLRAGHREAKPSGCRGCDTVLHGFGPIFLVITATLIVDLGIAIEPGGNFLFEGRVGKEVAGELFDRELIKRHVFIEGLDDPLAI